MSFHNFFLNVQEISTRFNSSFDTFTLQLSYACLDSTILHCYNDCIVVYSTYYYLDQRYYNLLLHYQPSTLNILNIEPYPYLPSHKLLVPRQHVIYVNMSTVNSLVLVRLHITYYILHTYILHVTDIHYNN